MEFNIAILHASFATVFFSHNYSVMIGEGGGIIKTKIKQIIEISTIRKGGRGGRRIVGVYIYKKNVMEVRKKQILIILYRESSSNFMSSTDPIQTFLDLAAEGISIGRLTFQVLIAS